MKTKIAVLSLTGMIVLQGCSTMSSPSEIEQLIAQTKLMDASGRVVGDAQIVRSSSTLYLNASVTGQAIGEHGIHFHAVGKCDAPGFTTAGGHLNPMAHQHGSMNPAGPHLGDLPNIVVAAGGSGLLKAPLSGAPNDLIAKIFDEDGTAIVLHAGPDDYKTDPSGNSGGRVACGVLEKSSN